MNCEHTIAVDEEPPYAEKPKLPCPYPECPSSPEGSAFVVNRGRVYRRDQQGDSVVWVRYPEMER